MQPKVINWNVLLPKFSINGYGIFSYEHKTESSWSNIKCSSELNGDLCIFGSYIGIPMYYIIGTFNPHCQHELWWDIQRKLP